MKSIACTLLMNTRNGHVLAPVNCSSIRQALKIASENGLAYRIFVNGQLVKSGWTVRT